MWNTTTTTSSCSNSSRSSAAENIVTLRQFLTRVGVTEGGNNAGDLSMHENRPSSGIHPCDPCHLSTGMIKRLAVEQDRIFDSITTAGEVLALGDAAEWVMRMRDISEQALLARSVIERNSNFFAAISKTDVSLLGPYPRIVHLKRSAYDARLTHDSIHKRDVTLNLKAVFDVELHYGDEYCVAAGKLIFPNFSRTVAVEPERASIVHDLMGISDLTEAVTKTKLINLGYEPITDYSKKYFAVAITPKGLLYGSGTGSRSVLDHSVELADRKRLMDLYGKLSLPTRSSIQGFFDFTLNTGKHITPWKAQPYLGKPWVAATRSHDVMALYSASEETRQSLLSLFSIFDETETPYEAAKADMIAVTLIAQHPAATRLQLAATLFKEFRKYKAIEAIAMGGRTPIVSESVMCLQNASVAALLNAADALDAEESALKKATLTPVKKKSEGVKKTTPVKIVPAQKTPKADSWEVKRAKSMLEMLEPIDHESFDEDELEVSESKTSVPAFKADEFHPVKSKIKYRISTNSAHFGPVQMATIANIVYSSMSRLVYRLADPKISAVTKPNAEIRKEFIAKYLKPKDGFTDSPKFKPKKLVQVNNITSEVIVTSSMIHPIFERSVKMGIGIVNTKNGPNPWMVVEIVGVKPDGMLDVCGMACCSDVYQADECCKMIVHALKKVRSYVDAPKYVYAYST